MESGLFEISYDFERLRGEPSTLTEAAPGFDVPWHWQVSIRPAHPHAPRRPVRNHSEVVNGNAPEDESWYNDYPAG
jgi:hypothetical protein